MPARAARGNARTQRTIVERRVFEGRRHLAAQRGSTCFVCEAKGGTEVAGGRALACAGRSGGRWCLRATAWAASCR